MPVLPALQFGAVSWALLQRLFVVAALIGGAALTIRLEDGRLLSPLRNRFVFGVPWGSVVTLLGVLGVYLFVQGGYWHWYRPVVIPFRAWSYFEPLGMVVGGFAHAGPGHLLGNLFGALTLAPVVEYILGHYPPDGKRKSHDGESPAESRSLRERFDGFRRNPFVRAFLLLPVGVGIVGVLLTMFTIGAVIGFSGVVFALAGFALVRYPLGTVLALLTSDLLRLVYRALQNPTSTASGRSQFITPWWADIAIQGHAIGLLAGVVLAVALLQRRGETPPSPVRLWIGGLLFASMQSLWATYWYRGGTEYVLFRALGLGLIALAATLIVVAVAGPERPLFGAGGDSDDTSIGVERDDDDEPTSTRSITGTGQGDASDDPRSEAWEDSPPETGISADESQLRSLTTRQAGMVLLLLVAAVLSGPGIAVNLVAAEGDLPGDPATTRGYEVTYAEGVQDGMVSAIPVTAFGETTQVTTSGIIVSNPAREIWQTVVSKGRLAANGRATVVVGALGWRETVTFARQGWTTVGGGTAYRVALVSNQGRRTVYSSGPARAEPQIAGQNISVVSGTDSFQLLVSEGNETVRRPLPGKNESVTLRNVTFSGDGDRVVATHNGTRITVLKKETYN